MKDQQKTVVLREYNTATEANIVKSMLEANGVSCFLSNENSVFTPGFFSASSTVLLHVMEEDFEKASSLIDQIPEAFTDEES
ncbi:MAG: DUF2007 domain-containing protein [Bacteroidales bacterium]|nr:DUF2007 domain-containing protein [Bacteroidales bacterium]MDD3431479.1 DUF2007 domain-containing protein [Bacteroidales bacterium]MDD4361992.1 DUF2007 domain-containing protein [Bacteroidales bacterium]MDD4430125.1 DUF2007 domain-containing protein [Bacteroidales bacterium]